MEDLFSEYKTTAKRSKRHLSEGLFISPEAFIGGVILFIISLILAFSLGVEQGKRIARGSKVVVKKEIASVEAKQEVKAPAKKTASRPKPAPAPKPKPEMSQPKPTTTTSSKVKKMYAVQLVVYRDKKYAERELKYLKRQKYPFYKEVKNGKIIISAGPFATLEEAKKAERALKKRYKDCFVKIVRKR